MVAIYYPIVERTYTFLQGKEVGALELHLGGKEYYILKCKDGGKPERGNYQGSDGKNGIWKITKTNGVEPVIEAYFDNELKFKVQMSDTECSDRNWRNYWSNKEVATIKFVSKASTQYRKGNQKHICILHLL